MRLVYPQPPPQHSLHRSRLQSRFERRRRHDLHLLILLHHHLLDSVHQLRMVRLLRQLRLTLALRPHDPRLLQRRGRVQQRAEVLRAQQLVAAQLRVQLPQQHLVEVQQLRALHRVVLSQRGERVGLQQQRLLERPGGRVSVLCVSHPAGRYAEGHVDVHHREEGTRQCRWRRRGGGEQHVLERVEGQRDEPAVRN